MSFFEKIMTCDESEVASLVRDALKTANDLSIKNERIGFQENLKPQKPHKGFINSSTRIKYCNFEATTYSMKTIDYFYEFVKILRQSGVKTKAEFINIVQVFINEYFGLNSSRKDLRSEVIFDKAWQSTKSDEELFSALENNEIGDFKGKNVALCTERAAIAQNLLSLFGFETYYCIGCIEKNGVESAHCYNIVKAPNVYVLLDYSQAVPMYQDNEIMGYEPFTGNIPFDKIDSVLNGDLDITLEDYYYEIGVNGYQYLNKTGQRKYIVGATSLKCEPGRK